MERSSSQLLAVLGAFAAGVGLAELLGAASLGIAFGFGQIAFTLALGWVLLRARAATPTLRRSARPRPEPDRPAC